ncbi:hypothetical protein ACJ73_01921 [Blastomyces percursus]|uniref:Uncharacterized protein n=1 Tax=Blastomyces percursus TaxID=1658174 RepID=A0A1J9QF03_9EURO|nr:hypothetical protein ACJ73_01921 [Blastomyces percursus]
MAWVWDNPNVNPNVKRVLNWLIPKSVCTVLQRAGRAARGRNELGEFIWFIPPKKVSKQGKGKNIVQELLADEEEQAGQEKAPGGTVAAPATAGHKKNTTQCTRMPERVISCLYNKGCLRREILTHFDWMPDVWIERDRCCSSCSNPELARLPVITELEHPKDEYQSAPKAAGPFIRKKLEEWQDKAAQQLAEDHPMSIAGTKKWILKPERLDSWIKNAMALRVREEDPNQPIPLWHWSVDEFRRLNSDWHWLDRRGFAVGVVEAIKNGFHDYLNSLV